MTNKHRRIDTLSSNMIVLLSSVFIICFSALIISQMIQVTQERQKAIEQNLAMLAMTQASVEGDIGQAIKLSKMLLLNKNVSRFMYLPPIPEGSSEIQEVIDAQAQLPTARYVDPMILELFVYSRASDSLLTSSNAFFDIDAMYPLFAFEGMNARQWQSKYLWSSTSNRWFPVTDAIVDGQQRKVLPYVSTYPLLNPSENAGKVMLLLDAQLFFDMLDNLDLGTGGAYCVTDFKDSVILSSGASTWTVPKLSDGHHLLKDSDGKRFIVSVESSETSGLRFFSAVPYSYGKLMFNPVLTVISLVCAIALCVCFLILGGNAYGSQRDWNRLKQLLDTRNGTNPASYEQIADSIRSITADRNKEDIQSGMAPYMVETLFRRLIHGKEIDNTALIHLMQQMHKTVMVSPATPVVMLKIFWNRQMPNMPMDVADFTRLAAEHEAHDQFGSSCYLYMDYSYNIWVLAWASARSRLNTCVDAFWKAFKKYTSDETSVAVSGNDVTVADIAFAPRQCDRVEWSLRNERLENILRKYDEIEKRIDSFCYGKDEEKALIAACMKQDLDQTNSVLEALYEQNYHVRKLSSEQEHELLNALYRTAFSYCQKQGRTVVPTHFTLFEDALSFFEEQARRTSPARNEREVVLADEIGNYIAGHYQEPALTLTTMAQDLKLKESYLYHFMYARLNNSFASYLEAYRLQQAKDMLSDSHHPPINEVAMQCGYANAQTFRRAFRKCYGVNPSDFRL